MQYGRHMQESGRHNIYFEIEISRKQPQKQNPDLVAVNDVQQFLRICLLLFCDQPQRPSRQQRGEYFMIARIKTKSRILQHMMAEINPPIVS